MGFVSDPEPEPGMSSWWRTADGGEFTTDMPTWVEIVGQQHAPFIADRMTHRGAWVREHSGHLGPEGVHVFEIAVPGRWRITVEGGAEVAAWG